MEGIMSKFRSMHMEGVSIEQQSIISNIFTQFDQVRVTGVNEPIRELLDIQINDQRI